jgi:hypothetical protein
MFGTKLVETTTGETSNLSLQIKQFLVKKNVVPQEAEQYCKGEV